MYERLSFLRYALVGQDTMLRGTRTFFETGRRDPGCKWGLERDAFSD
jgi:hypothetical protein